MTDLLVDSTVVCPSCWEKHTVTIDLTESDRYFIEDCYVCCNPMRIEFEIDAEGNLQSLNATTP